MVPVSAAPVVSAVMVIVLLGPVVGKIMQRMGLGAEVAPASHH